MLIPPGMSKKERKAYVKRHTHQTDSKKINRGPKAGLRPVGGGPKEPKIESLPPDADVKDQKVVAPDADSKGKKAEKKDE